VANQNLINLHDRVKELSTTTGTGNFGITGAVRGFTSFDSVYNHLDPFFYAITDGHSYEVGSGVFYKAGEQDDNGATISYNYIKRNPFKSSSNNGLVNFPAGVKEVFVTNPATHSVFMGSGLGNLNVPKRKGIAIWDSENILNYDSRIIWDSTAIAIGIQQPNPVYGLDLGGSGDTSSMVRATGYYVGSTGIYFQQYNGNDSSYSGGTQYKHFLPNETNVTTKSSLVLETSGVVDQVINFKKQSAGYVFAGPVPDNCFNPPCSPDYPEFRLLNVKDIPDLSSIYITTDQINAVSGALQSSIDSWQLAASGKLFDDFASLSGIISSYIVQSSGNLNDHMAAQSGQLYDFMLIESGRLDNHLALFHDPVYLSVVGSGNSFGTSLAASSAGSRNSSTLARFAFDNIESDSQQTPSWDTSTYLYTVPVSGHYTFSAHMTGENDHATTSVPSFRLVTSGDGSATNHNFQYILASNGEVQSVSKEWNIDLPSGYLAYIEFSGKFYDNSSLSIHRM